MAHFYGYYNSGPPQDYYQYDLWQNSKFNSGFHYHNVWGASSLTDTSHDNPPEARENEDPSDVEEEIVHPRIITKEALYDESVGYPSIEIDDDDTDTSESHSPGFDWTQKHWQKAGTPQTPTSNRQYRQNKIQKQLNKATAMPVEMNKATVMMQKMGWEGGPLGRSGGGIVEPITPNAAYATKTTVGLGHKEDPKPPKPNQQKPKKPKPEKPKKVHRNKNQFVTNLLYILLEYVKDDKVLELQFDERLIQRERKVIHGMVNYVGFNYEEAKLNLNSEQKKLLEEVQQYNNFVLHSQSVGRVPRKLSIFKVANDYSYVVTPDDIRDEVVEETDEQTDEELSLNEIPEKDENDSSPNDDAAKSPKKVASPAANDAKSPENIASPTANEAKLRHQNISSTANEDVSGTANQAQSPEKVASPTAKQAGAPEYVKSSNAKPAKAPKKVLNSVTKKVKTPHNLSATTNAVKSSEKDDAKEIEENPFLRSITKNIREETSEVVAGKKDMIEIVKDYFVEFLEQEIYTEFRFLGPFTGTEIDRLIGFMNAVTLCIVSKVCDPGYEAILRGIIEDKVHEYEVKEDCNESIVVFRYKKETK